MKMGIMAIFLFALVIHSDQTLGQSTSTIYEYKKYEKFDLGALELTGELIAPGDVTVREREFMKVKMDHFNRKKMNDLKMKDARSLK